MSDSRQIALVGTSMEQCYVDKEIGVISQADNALTLCFFSIDGMTFLCCVLMS